jgi:diguanylate cyclase (GGDEF)-like protein
VERDGPAGVAPEIPAGGPSRLRLAWWYAFAGACLSLGAPAGALLLRVAGGANDLRREISEHLFFYLYELFGSCLVFGTAGFLVGRRSDLLRVGRDLYRELSEHDPLTGLLNARTFYARYRRAVEHARRFHEPLSLLVIDVDRLKESNDTYGHAYGTAVLLHVARAITTCKREEDLAARWGGDEFAVLMTGAEPSAGRRCAEEIRDRVPRTAPPCPDAARTVSVTIGVATQTGGGDEKDLFERADRALYEGKRVGRGQVRENP